MLVTPDRLSSRFQELICDPKNSVSISMISYWELKIKEQLGKLEISPNLISELNTLGIPILEFGVGSVSQLDLLPHLHRDPFDRAILAHSIEHRLTLLTADLKMMQYGSFAKILDNSG